MNTAKNKQAFGRPREVLRSTRGSIANALLTSKELTVLELVSYGYDNRAIAEHFQVTQQAVKNLLRIVQLKLGADNRAHAVAVCFRNGWLSAPGRGAPVPDAQHSESTFGNLTRN